MINLIKNNLYYNYSGYFERLNGKRAGCYDKDGYRIIKIKGKSYKEHHLVYYHFNNEWPDYLHHINGVRDDNRIENLERCTHKENMQHMGYYSNNKTGFKGVDFIKKKNKYRARYKQKHIGYFDTAEEAHTAREEYSINDKLF